MSDLSITAANVAKGSGAAVQTKTAGATITAGKLVYLDSNDQAQLADCDVLATAACAGIALHATLSGQPLTYQYAGNIDPGATTVVAELYVVANASGGIMPIGDLGSGDYLFLFGVGTTTSNIELLINMSAAALKA